MLIKLAHFVFILFSAQGNTTHQCSFCRVMPLGLKTVTLCTELIVLNSFIGLPWDISLWYF